MGNKKLRDEYEWEIVGGENYQGTKTGWSLVKAVSINETDSFDLDILLCSEHHDDFGGFGMSQAQSLNSYTISFVGVNFDEEGEPIVAASNIYENPLEEIDELEEYVKNEYGLLNELVDGLKEFLPRDNVRKLDLPAFDISVEIDDNFYGIDIEADSLFFHPRDYRVKASNAVETPVKVGKIPDEEHREVAQEYARNQDGEKRIERAVEKLVGNYLNRNHDVEFENPMNPQPNEIT